MFLQDDRVFARAAELVNGVASGVLEGMTSSSSSSAFRSATAVAVGVSVAAVAVVIVAYATGNAGFLFPGVGRGGLGPPWRRKRKRYPRLSLQQWREAFDPVDGRLIDGGDKVIDVVRRGGVDHQVRAELWPFLLGVHDSFSTREKRNVQSEKKKEEYLELRSLCALAHQFVLEESESSVVRSVVRSVEPGSSPPGGSSGRRNSDVLRASEVGDDEQEVDQVFDAVAGSGVDSIESSGDGENDDVGGPDVDHSREKSVLSEKLEALGAYDPKWVTETSRAVEDFGMWQRIIRLDAIRMNADWLPFSTWAASVTEDVAEKLADEVGLRDTEHLEAARKHFGARLVGILEAYTMFDSETGYCQGMSDLLAPFVAIIEDDSEAFWCFSNFMRAARHNFRLDETGIQRQLDLVARILKAGDPQLYEHLVRIRSEDCTFVYRMILVFLRRELSFEQSLNLWEVIWADWAVLRRNNGGSVGSKSRTPASSDLLLYTIAAAVRNKKDHILEYCRGMDDMLKECNDMAGHLEVWELLDDARELVRSFRGTLQ